MRSDLPKADVSVVKRVPWRKWLRRRTRYFLLRAAAAALALLPLRLASAIGARFGALAWMFSARERTRALDSLAVAFPERSDQERRVLGQECFAHLGRSIFELACWRQVDRRIEQLVDWPAADRAVLDTAVARGKGVIFVTGHVGHWELLARRVALAGYPCATIAKEATDPKLTEFIEDVRAAAGLKAIWRGRPGAVKEMLRILRTGGLLGLLIDQDTKVQSVYVPFFGREAKTPRAAADIALRADAAVVLGFCHRTGPTSFRIMMREVAKPAATGEAAVLELTHALTRGIEEAIRSAPEQWVWMHRRWRSRPETRPAFASV